MRSRSSSPSLESQRYDLAKRSELKSRTLPPCVPPASDILDSRETPFTENDRVSLDSPYTLGGDTSNQHITALVNIGLSLPSDSSPYISDEAHTSESSLSTTSFAANEAYDAHTLQQGHLYATKNSTVLIIRRRTSFFSLDLLSKSPPNSTVPSADWKSSINDTLSTYGCGPCAHKNSAFEDDVANIHKKYEKKLKGEGRPIEIRYHETRSVTVEERWRKPAQGITYPLPDNEKNVASTVEIF